MAEEIEIEDQVTPDPKKKSKASKEDATLSKVLKKLDAIEKRLNKEDAEEKEDADPRDALLEKAAEVFRGLLKGALPEERLSKMDCNDLITAIELKKELKPEIGNPAPKADATSKNELHSDTMLGVRFL